MRTRPIPTGIPTARTSRWLSTRSKASRMATPAPAPAPRACPAVSSPAKPTGTATSASAAATTEFCALRMPDVPTEGAANPHAWVVPLRGSPVRLHLQSVAEAGASRPPPACAFENAFPAPGRVSLARKARAIRRYRTWIAALARPASPATRTAIARRVHVLPAFAATARRPPASAAIAVEDVTRAPKQRSHERNMRSVPRQAWSTELVPANRHSSPR